MEWQTPWTWVTNQQTLAALVLGAVAIIALIVIHFFVRSKHDRLPPRSKPSDEDIRKIHAEVTQISNQRFLLVTAGLSVYPFFALMLRLETTDENEKIVIVELLALTLAIIHGLLYIHSFLLRLRQRTLSAYLLATKASVWEEHWYVYRKKAPGAGLTQPQTVAFIIYGILNFAILNFFVVNMLFKKQAPEYVYWCVSAVSVVYIVAVVVMDVLSLPFSEKRAIKRWEEILDC